MEDLNERKFSWTEYSVFFLLGIAMLWAWFVFPITSYSQVIQ